MLGPRVERVVDRRLEGELSLVVDPQEGEAIGDGGEAGGLGGDPDVLGDVGSMDDRRHERDRRVVDLVRRDERLERAHPVAMGVHRAGRVEGDGALAFGEVEDLVARDVDDLGLQGR